MTAWLDQVAADLLAVDADLGAALRAIRHGQAPAHGRRAVGDYLEVRTGELRTLLRATMPAQIAVSRLRTPHARMVASMALLQQHVLALNDSLQHPAEAISAACTAVDELRAWIGQVRWAAAARRARIRWPAPPPDRAIIPLIELQGRTAPEHLPNAPAGRLQHPANPTRWVRARAHAQLHLDLGQPRSAEVIDLRQLRLAIEPQPPDTGVHHALQSA